MIPADDKAQTDYIIPQKAPLPADIDHCDNRIQRSNSVKAD